MRIEVNFEIKNWNVNTDDLLQEIQYEEVCGSIEQKSKQCIIKLEGEEDLVIKVLRLIWEVIFLYEGYFYVPTKYIVDDKEKKPEELYFLSYYRCGETWRNAATSLSKNRIDISADRLFQYDTFRNTSRDSGKLLKSLINSFYYLHSEAYEKINVNHRLSLFLNLCDGYIINTKGKSNNVQANITNVLGENLNVKLIKYGAGLLGIPQKKLYDALADERNEIDHYDLQKESVSSYIFNREDRKSNFVNWYFIYVVELALRIGFLKKIGFVPSDEEIEYAMNEINDWFIYECELDEDCKNPINKMKQDMRRSGITIR